MSTITAKMSSKGQITLPAALRNELALKPGDRVDFRKTDAGNYEIVAKRYTLSELRAFIAQLGPIPDRETLRTAVEDARAARADELYRRFQERQAK